MAKVRGKTHCALFVNPQPIVKRCVKKKLLSKNGAPWDMEKIQRVVYNIQIGTFDSYFKQWEELHQEKLC